MKYFKNITTAEELKKQFRTLCQTMHPDKGGNADEFKAMNQEYKTICKDFDRIKEEQEEAAEAERQRKEYERAEAERKAKEEAERARLRPEYLARCKKWEHLMKEVPAGYTMPRDWWTLSKEEMKKHREAERAAERKQNSARRANILGMCRAAFPGVKFSLNYRTGWGNHYTVEWEDGPTVEELKEATDLDLFVSGWDTFDGMTDCAGRAKAMFIDFAKKYNGKDGEIKVNRKASAKTFEKVCDIIKEHASQMTEDGDHVITFAQKDAIMAALNIQGEKAERAERRARNCYRGLENLGSDGFARVSLSEFANILCEYLPTIKAEEAQAKTAPEFRPRHNDIYKKVVNCMKSHALGTMTINARGNWQRASEEILNLYALIDFAPDCGLWVGNVFEYGPKHNVTKRFSVFYSSSRANDKKRIDRYAAIGITIKASGEILAVSPEIIEGLKADRASVEEQRKQWEAKQNGNEQNEPQASASEAADGQTLAEGDGVQLVATDKGAKLTGNTYAHKSEIKALGARWYRLGQCWTISADKVAEAVALVNSWNDDQNNEPTATADQATAEAVATFAATLYEICANIAKAAHEAQEQAEKTASEAQATATPDEPTTAPNEPTTATAEQVATLRQNIANLSAQMAAMSEQLRQMSEQLANLTANPTEEPTAPTEGGKAQETATSSPRYTSAENLGNEEREKVRQTFARGAEEYEAMTEANEHTRAIYCAGLALLFVLDDEKEKAVSSLLNVLQLIEDKHTKRGHILPEEMATRQTIADTLTLMTVKEFGAELAAVLWGEYQVKKMTTEDEQRKAA